LVGGLAGSRAAHALAAYKGLLNRVFAVLIFGVAAYTLVRSGAAIGIN